MPALVAKYSLQLDDAIGRALDDPGNESCKPGDPAFARAHFELIARPRNSLDAAVRKAKDAGYDILDLGADLEGEARDVAADHARLALQARLARATSRRNGSCPPDVRVTDQPGRPNHHDDHAEGCHSDQPSRPDARVCFDPVCALLDILRHVTLLLPSLKFHRPCGDTPVRSPPQGDLMRQRWPISRDDRRRHRTSGPR